MATKGTSKSKSGGMTVAPKPKSEGGQLSDARKQQAQVQALKQAKIKRASNVGMPNTTAKKNRIVAASKQRDMSHKLDNSMSRSPAKISNIKRSQAQTNGAVANSTKNSSLAYQIYLKKKG